jgi:hypothetical protein
MPICACLVGRRLARLGAKVTRDTRADRKTGSHNDKRPGLGLPGALAWQHQWEGCWNDLRRQDYSTDSQGSPAKPNNVTSSRADLTTNASALKQQVFAKRAFSLSAQHPSGLYVLVRASLHFPFFQNMYVPQLPALLLFA